MISLYKHLNESLLDDEEELINDDSLLIEKYLKENYTINGKYSIVNNEVNIDGNLSILYTVRDKIKHLTNGLFRFNSITGEFFCNSCKNLESLEGGPRYVGGDFYIHKCPKITDLTGGPRYVGGDFYIHKCPKITDLTGAPEEVGGSFNIIECKKLQSLKGAYDTKMLNFNCRDCIRLKENPIKVLKYVKKNIYGVNSSQDK